MNIQSQNKQIMKAMKNGRHLTAIDALGEFGCFRMSGRIYDIKEMLRGTKYKVEDKWVQSSNGKRFKEYWIARVK